MGAINKQINKNKHKNTNKKNIKMGAIKKWI